MPSLREGDKLLFTLRANATKDRGTGNKDDVVMDALSKFDKVLRPQIRLSVANTEGLKWLDRKARTSGFRVIGAEVSSYKMQPIKLGRGRRSGRIQLGVLEFTGALQVQNPGLFLTSIAAGFGRAKSYGCGLMMVKPLVH